MNKEVLNKIDEIMQFIEKSSDYQKYLYLKKQIENNQELVILINKVKVLQKDIIHHLAKREELDKLMNELYNHPLYREYNNTVSELNNIYAIIENRINKYFQEKLN